MGCLRQVSHCAALALLGGAVVIGKCSQVLAETTTTEAGSQVVVRRADLQRAVHTEAKGLLESALAQAEPTTPAVEPAQAQMAPPADDAEELDEVTVTGTGTYRRSNSSTATKTDTPILDTPQSIQVIPRQVIEDQGTVRLRDALRNVSGVYLSGTDGNYGEYFNIRGFSSNTYINAFLPNALPSLRSRQHRARRGAQGTVLGALRPRRTVGYHQLHHQKASRPTLRCGRFHGGQLRLLPHHRGSFRSAHCRRGSGLPAESCLRGCQQFSWHPGQKDVLRAGAGVEN
ncbi:TonB-dependent receptor plug domain-containing protein [Gloeobacter morelensis]|uniref:TonB-dependent receptor plug domain-containing protein n=1 Tax=Gloeobacter morelensis TaxID=2907343 RepID=UPI001E3191BF|nr:TonB-dependent receptor plug domain-containing protein [Gloeobacter morelensis]